MRGSMMLILGVAIVFSSVSYNVQAKDLSAKEKVAKMMKDSGQKGSDPQSAEKKEAPEWAEDLFGSELVKSDKSTVSTAELADKDMIALYFSAHWCPPCRAFTPKLVEAYDKAKKNGAKIELVFVSSDRDEKAMYGYMKDTKMKWLALPYDGPRRKLGSKYGVRGIPTLIFLDGDGEVITKNGRSEVMKKGAAAFE